MKNKYEAYVAVEKQFLFVITLFVIGRGFISNLCNSICI